MTEQEERVSRLTAIAEGLGAGASDGWAGIQSVVRELDQLEPGSLDRLRTNLAQRHIARGLPAFARR